MDMKNWLVVHKYQVMVFLFVTLFLFIVGCSSGQAPPPPSGPIGGGCG